MIGRRLDQLRAAGTDWEPAEQKYLEEGLPFDVTFAWDRVTDTIAAVYHAGASTKDLPHGGLVRQVIHGGAGYDDPLGVTALTPLYAEAPSHLYPVYDEGGAGNLQLVFNDAGEIVARSGHADPYGEGELTLTGAAVEKVSLSAKKDAAGTVEHVDVTLRLTEMLRSDSVANGVRIATVDAEGAVQRTASATAELLDPWTIRARLTGEQWSELSSLDPLASSLEPPASSLSIAATSELRASAWSYELPVLPAPAWVRATRTVHSSTDLPVDVRESLATLAQWLAGIPAAGEATNTLYEITDHALLGSSRTGTAADLLLASSFKAHPYHDPITRLDYVRARDYDRATGTWLTPDPMGYVDSSNLYAFCGRDPINRRDPTGTYGVDVHYYLTLFLSLKAGFPEELAFYLAEAAQRPDEDDRAPVKNWLRTQRLLSPRERERGATNLGTWHFAKGDPLRGEVVPNSRYARAVVTTGVNRADLNLFGEGLHPLQDSWSHQGRPAFGHSGHPWRRRGPASHAADVPHEFPNDAFSAALGTYQQLRRFAKIYPEIAGTNPSAKWSDIHEQVWFYLNLKDRSTKRAWMESQLRRLLGRRISLSKHWENVPPGPDEVRTMRYDNNLKYLAHDGGGGVR